MDISKEFIKMCEKAEKIQRDHIWNMGDWAFKKFNNTLICFEEINYRWPPARHLGEHLVFNRYIDGMDKTDFIWLPRQDQLQEMIGYKECFELRFQIHYKKPYFILTRYGNVENNFQPNIVRAESMEQVWLAFVMLEKYNKVWNGEDWIKQ